ncbi:hypothetical protein M3Y97_01050600 [Aphelenchoides bicaudatus]|nr:hypothetical protein M3Y97_01050600 [Aphelenchoides bicaudatus]
MQVLSNVPNSFIGVRQEIIKMFEFSTQFKQQIDRLAKEVFGDDTSPKICAHIWRNTFYHEGTLVLPTTEPFTSKALDYLATTVAQKNGLNKVSLLLFNDDANFTNNVIRQVKKNVHVKNIFTLKNSKPVEDIGMAARHCDYFLLTSSGLSFSWWMAYLLPDKKQQNIYYNSLVINKHLSHMIKVFREEEFFPVEWSRLVYSVKQDKVFVQDRSIPPILY